MYNKGLIISKLMEEKKEEEEEKFTFKLAKLHGSVV